MNSELLAELLELACNNLNEGNYLIVANYFKHIHKDISIIDDRVVKTLTNPIRIVYNNTGYFDVTAYSWKPEDGYSTNPSTDMMLIIVHNEKTLKLYSNSTFERFLQNIMLRYFVTSIDVGDEKYNFKEIVKRHRCFDKFVFDLSQEEEKDDDEEEKFHNIYDNEHYYKVVEKTFVEIILNAVSNECKFLETGRDYVRGRYQSRNEFY